MPASPPAVSTPAVLSTSATVSAMEERELRVRLGYWLQGQGACNTEQFLRAFQEVPRHELVREGWFIGWDGSRIHSRDCTAEEWMNILYHDMPVFIRDEGPMLSSSSMPSIMGRMLDLLRLEDGSTVLEIGTGSGYNAALLCHRLGSERVTSIDVQADLVQTARERLGALGYEPYLATADGLTGYPPRARYDRVIGTCCAWPIPTSWIEQTRPGGRVVAVIPDGCVGLDVREDGSASGALHPHQFQFMPMIGYMPDQLPSGEPRGLTGTPRPWRQPPDVLFAGGLEQCSFAALALTVLVRDQRRWDGWQLERLRGLIDQGDRSWVVFDRQRGEVTQGGPRRLWDEVERLFDAWCALGAPNRDRFGLTVHPDGRHMLWLDDPDGEHRWEARR
jgi:protein-L-isoaspartate(D-aspartate) O-methyltransferase